MCTDSTRYDNSIHYVAITISRLTHIQAVQSAVGQESGQSVSNTLIQVDSQEELAEVVASRLPAGVVGFVQTVASWTPEQQCRGNKWQAAGQVGRQSGDKHQGDMHQEGREL